MLAHAAMPYVCSPSHAKILFAALCRRCCAVEALRCAAARRREPCMLMMLPSAQNVMPAHACRRQRRGLHAMPIRGVIRCCAMIAHDEAISTMQQRHAAQRHDALSFTFIFQSVHMENYLSFAAALSIKSFCLVACLSSPPCLICPSFAWSSLSYATSLFSWRDASKYLIT